MDLFDFFFGDPGRKAQTIVLGLALVALIFFSSRVVLTAHRTGLPDRFVFPALWWFLKGLVFLTFVWWLCSNMRLLGSESADTMWRLLGVALIGFFPFLIMLVSYEKLYRRLTEQISNDEEPVRRFIATN